MSSNSSPPVTLERRGGAGLTDSTLSPGKPPQKCHCTMHGGRTEGAARGPALCPAGGTRVWFKASLQEGLGGGGGHITLGKHGAARGLGDALNHYSQVKYQVVVALFGDAVVEPHCSRDRRVMGYTWLPPCSLGMLLLPFGHKQELGKGTAGLFLLLLPLAGWGVPAHQGTPAMAPAWGSCARLKDHIQTGDCPEAAPGQGSRQLLGYLGHWAGCRHGCPQSHQERCPSRGRAQQGAELTILAPTGLFYFLLMTFLFSLGISTG